MKKRRIIWLIVTAAAAAMYMFSNETVTMAVFAAFLSAPLFSLVFLLSSGRKLKAELKQKTSALKENQIILILKNSSIIPAALARAQIRWHNLRTDSRDVLEIGGYVPGRRKTKIIALLPDDHAGVYEIKIGGIWVYDPLGMFRRFVKADGYIRSVISPDGFDIDINYIESPFVMNDSYRYSREKRGNDPGEVKAIREYVPGDPVKNIHWKLSEKMDKLLVKELGMPVQDRLLVLLDTQIDDKTSCKKTDASADVFSSVLKSLIEKDIDFTAGWLDKTNGRLITRKIASHNDAKSAAWEYLAVPPQKSSIMDDLEMMTEENRFEHIVTVGNVIPQRSGAAAPEDLGLISALVCGAKGYTENDGIRVIGFSEKKYKNELKKIEI